MEGTGILVVTRTGGVNEITSGRNVEGKEKVAV